MLYNYFIEIRNRSLLLFLTWFSLITISYLHKEIVLFIFVKPSLCLFKKNSLYFIFTGLTEIFSTYIKLSYFLGNQITFIFMLYHLLLFVTPGLHSFEYKNLRFIYVLSFLFWIISIIFLNILILPFSWQFFLSFQKTISNQAFNFYFEAKINEYLKFYVTIYYVCVLNLQFFVSLFIFLDCIKENLRLVKKFRKLFYFLFFLIATLITPPEIFSQLFIGFSMVIFYEIIIISIILKTKLNNIN